MKKRDKIIEEARQRYEYAREQWGPIYKAVRDDLDFSDPTGPKQWTDAARREREMSEGGPRPCLTFDQTGQYVRQVINTARRNKPAMKFLPVDDKSDPRMADILQGLARQVEYDSRADVAYITALDHATRGGLGMYRLITEPVENGIPGQVCAKIVRIVDPTTALPDPDFIEPDGSDQEWGLIEQVIPKAEFRRKWPKAGEVDFDEKGWFGKDHVRICEYFRRVRTNKIKAAGKELGEDAFWAAKQDSPELEPEGTESQIVVEWYKISGEEILEQTTFPGEFIPIFPVLGNESWSDGKRKLSGCIRTARDAQVTYNFERNAAFEAVAVGPKAPFIAAIEAIDGHQAQWKMANRGNLAYLPWNHKDENGDPVPPPSRINPAGIAAGWMQLSENSRRDIQSAMGFYDASVGDNPNQQSGRAVMALQDKADVGSYHYIDNLALSISHLGRVLTKVWPVIYDAQQIVRIIGEDEEPQFVTVDPSLPAPYAEVPGQQGSQIVINPGVGRYDVRCVVGPAYQTRSAEAAAEIGELVNGNPQMMALLGDMWVKMRNYPDADKIARRLNAMLPPQVREAEGEGPQQLPPEVQQALQQAGNEIQQLRLALDEAKSGLIKAKMDNDTKERIASMNNVTEWMTANLDAMASLIAQKIQPPPAMQSEVAQGGASFN